MNIEVTKITFYKVITNTNRDEKLTDFLRIEKKESSHKYFYYNNENQQGGLIVNNFTNSKVITQYYLTDINS
jgi:hypothetical protein